MYEQLIALANLGATAAIALGVIAILWRVSERSRPRQPEIVLGYPSDRFPAHDVVGSRALTELAASQARLLSMYSELAPSSDAAKLLYSFLVELRAIMDLAYRVALVTRAYGQSPKLDRVVAEVRAIERELADHVVQRLLAYEADEQSALLDHRLATLRALVGQLAPAAEGRVALLAD
jgi:hypothetical protein